MKNDLIRKITVLEIKIQKKKERMSTIDEKKDDTDA